mmetsp:Transcript_26738/g.50268  ORF Transcript_26738/g.50268 Transcript_26738/m.50268 type:complete len:160 (-) Transcript_26738:150-629(-)
MPGHGALRTMALCVLCAVSRAARPQRERDEVRADQQVDGIATCAQVYVGSVHGYYLKQCLKSLSSETTAHAEMATIDGEHDVLDGFFRNPESCYNKAYDAKCPKVEIKVTQKGLRCTLLRADAEMFFEPGDEKPIEQTPSGAIQALKYFFVVPVDLDQH